MVRAGAEAVNLPEEPVAQPIAEDPFAEGAGGPAPQLNDRFSKMEHNVKALFAAANRSMGECEDIARIVVPQIGACWKLKISFAEPAQEAPVAEWPYEYMGFHACSFHSAIGILRDARIQGRSWTPRGGDGLLFVRAAQWSQHVATKVELLQKAFLLGTFGSEGIAFELLSRVNGRHEKCSGHDEQAAFSRQGCVTHAGTGPGSTWTFPARFTQIEAMVLRESVFAELNTEELLNVLGL
jgi:hypothetical protein